jgi:hypothetical protein
VVLPNVEPNGTVNAGAIAGFTAGSFLLIILGLYGAHRHTLRQQANRNRVKFAKRISETIHLEGSDRQLTADKLAAEFKKCSAEEDGTISEDDLWVFISSGQAGTMGQADFNGPFAAIYLDN